MFNPLRIMKIAITEIMYGKTLFIPDLNFTVTKPLNHDSENITGMVPKPNAAINKAPLNAEPVAMAPANPI